MKKTFLFITTCLLLSGSIHAQVTIGSGEKPNNGALLDLKDGGTYSNGETANKGLGMPRVELMTTNPVIGALAASIGGTGTWDEAAHTGLAVYNVKDETFNPATCLMTGAPIGLYVWDGTQWLGIGTSSSGSGSASVYKVTDSRDGEVYLARNFGAIAGDWMLENMRYIPNAADGFIHSAADTPGKHYVYAEHNGVYTPANNPIAWESRKKKWHAL